MFLYAYILGAKTFAGAGVIVAGLSLTLTQLLEHYGLGFGFESKLTRAALTLSRHKLSVELDPRWVERDELDTYLKSVVSTHDIVKNVRTVVVCGQRGVGKSAAVLHAFANTPGVVSVRGDGTLEGSLKGLLDDLNITAYGKNVVEMVLRKMNRMGLKPPLIIVDVDDRWSSKDVSDLLHKWGPTESYCDFFGKPVLVPS